jgi:CHAT domain-containing protein
MRAGFQESSGEALRRLIRLYVQQHDARHTFEAMERAKSHVLLGYLADRTHLRWRTNTPQSRALFDELERLRCEHHWFYKLAHERAPNDDGQLPSISAEQARAEVGRRERWMRALTERLYLEGDSGDAIAQTRAPRLEAIQHALGNHTLLAFYLDDQTTLAFVVRQNDIHMRPLALSAEALQDLLARLERNFAMALGVGPAGTGAAQLAQLARVLLQRLYDGLLAPLEDLLGGDERLVIAPYGALHYLPFHLLYNGVQHLIERREVVIVPTAGLLTRQPARRSGGARVLAHSWDGRLPQTQREAAFVHQIMGGTLDVERHASRVVLERPPTTVLHLAAHGEQRLDHPELSFIQLADAQLYTDDLLQHDLSYELVVLSACETGRAHVAAGDELIGLGRGFLYAGAGALITTLWRVDDVIATRVMEGLYSGLHQGASKAGALRATQQRILASDPRLHPAFWGAFQLVGDARPLSTAEALIRIEGEAHAESSCAG